MPVVSNILLALLGAVLVLRLVIWQFLHDAGPWFMEGFSDAIVAGTIAAIALPWLLKKIASRQVLPQSGLELPFFLFLSGAELSLLHTPDFAASLHGVLVLFAQIVFFYMLLDLLMEDPQRVRWAVTFLMGLAFITSAYGIITFYQLLTSPAQAGLEQTNGNLFYLLAHSRAISFIGWPTSLAGYLLLSLPLALILPFSLKSMPGKAAGVFVLFVVLVCFLYTFSFLPWISFLVCALVMWLLCRDKLGMDSWPALYRRMAVYGAGVVLLLFLMVVLRKDFLMSLVPRVFYYKVACHAILASPVWGHGWDSFGILCRRMADSRTNLSSFVHNSYLQVWVECGFVGFFGIVWLALEILRRAVSAVAARSWTPQDMVRSALAWGIMAFLLDNLSNFTLLKTNVALFWWAALAVFWAMDSRRQEGLSFEGPIKPSQARLFVQHMAGGMLVLVMFFMLLHITEAYALAYRAKKSSSYNQALSMVRQAEVVDPLSSYLASAEADLHMKAYAVTRRREFLQRAQAAYLEAIRRSPAVYYNYFALGEICQALGQPHDAAISMEMARQLSPREFEFDSAMFNMSP